MTEKELAELKAFIDRKSAIMTQREVQLMTKMVYELYIFAMKPISIIDCQKKSYDTFDKVLSVVIQVLTVLVGVALIVLATIAVYKLS